MKKVAYYCICSLAIIGLFLMITGGCKKKDDNSTPPASQVPVVTTDLVSNVAQTTATGGGNITSQGTSAATIRGVCWSTSSNPTTSNTHTTDGYGTGVFTSILKGLTPNTLYYVRAYATNGSGIAYGNSLTFTTQQGTGGTVIDIDGNMYNTVNIGTQVWMVENLKTTKYNDGTEIPLVTDSTEWSILTTPGYCWYNNDAGTCTTTYGALYNGYAVGTGKLCPSGWHVPTETEWTTLITYLGGDTVAGGKMISTGTIAAGTGLWYFPNTKVTNESGFTAVPAGGRYVFGFTGSRFATSWWSSIYGPGATWYRTVAAQNCEIWGSYSFNNVGYSVRCIQD